MLGSFYKTESEILAYEGEFICFSTVTFWPFFWISNMRLYSRLYSNSLISSKSQKLQLCACPNLINWDTSPQDLYKITLVHVGTCSTYMRRWKRALLLCAISLEKAKKPLSYSMYVYILQVWLSYDHSTVHSKILPEIIEWGPQCITDLFQNSLFLIYY